MAVILRELSLVMRQFLFVPVLKRLFLEEDRLLILTQLIGKQAQQRRLTRAIRPYYNKQFPVVYGYVYTVKYGKLAVRIGYFICF